MRQPAGCDGVRLLVLEVRAVKDEEPVRSRGAECPQYWVALAHEEPAAGPQPVEIQLSLSEEMACQRATSIAVRACSGSVLRLSSVPLRMICSGQAKPVWRVGLTEAVARDRACCSRSG